VHRKAGRNIRLTVITAIRRKKRNDKQTNFHRRKRRNTAGRTRPTGIRAPTTVAPGLRSPDTPCT
jgi:hypothetical protein